MNGHEITYALKSAGVKVKDIADKLGVSSPFVTQVIYRHRHTSRIQTAIAEAIGKPVDEIFPTPEEKAA